MGTLSDEEYEKQRTLTFRKGQRVKVVKKWTEQIRKLKRFASKHANATDSRWVESAKAAAREAAAMQNAVGNVYTVERYTIGFNPHGIYVDEVLIFLPAFCLQAT